MYIKSLPVRYFLLFIFCLISPPIILCGGIIAGALVYPVFPIYYMGNEGHQILCKCASSVKPCQIFLSFCLMLILYIPLAIAGVLAIVVGTFALVLYYIVGILLILRMFFV